MKLTIDKQCTLSGVALGITDQIKQALTMKNPAYIEAKKRNRWTGNIDKILYFFEETEDGKLLFPRGFIRQAMDIIVRSLSIKSGPCQVKLYLDTVGSGLSFQDDRRAYGQLDFKFIGKLRSYQDDAFTDVLVKDFGVLEALMGSGKTVVALAVIAARKQPTLILVHNKELLYQWRDKIAEFLGIEAGLLGDGHYDLRPVTVAIINSAKKHLADLPDYFGQIIIDECHRTPATMFSEVVRAFDCKYMLGLSATPYRRDGLTNLIYWFVGSLVHKIDPEGLKEAGAVLVPTIHTRETKFNYAKLLTLIILDKCRNDLIVQDIMVEARRPGTALVVSDRVEHCLLLAGILADRKPGLKIGVLTGQLKTGERTSLVEDIRAGKVDVVIATIQLIGEGFDCPRLSSLFLATPIKFSARLIQVVGRILRPEDGKKPRVYDYRDPVGPLFASARAREKTYEEMGWIEKEVKNGPE